MSQIVATFSEFAGGPTLSVDEFRQILAKLNISLTDSRVESLLSTAAVLENGRVDYTSFFSWLYDDEEVQLPPSGSLASTATSSRGAPLQVDAHSAPLQDQPEVPESPILTEADERLQITDACNGRTIRYGLHGKRLSKEQLGQPMPVTKLTLSIVANSTCWCEVTDDHGNSERLTVWDLEALGILASKADLEHNLPQVPRFKKAYRVTTLDSEQGQTSEGIQWHHGPLLSERVASWGAVIYGTPLLNWIKIEGYYLPMAVDGKSVVQPHGPPSATSYQDLADGFGCTIPLAEERGFTIQQLQTVADHIKSHCSQERWVDHSPTSPFHGQRLEESKVNLYQVVNCIIMPATHERQCSFVELVACKPQRPKWFASHWWGEPVLEFVCCVKSHAELRHISFDAAYWICAYANCQWDLGGELADDLEDTPFRKAMSMAEGTLSIVDKAGVTYERIWCDYEVAMMLKASDTKLYDIATCKGETAIVITDGLAAEDMVQGDDKAWQFCGGAYGHKWAREADFPVHLIAYALRICLERGSATSSIDRARILNSVSGRDLTLPPLEEHPSYESLNSALHWRLSLALLQAAAESNEIEDLDLWNVPEPIGWEMLGTYRQLIGVFESTGRFSEASELQERSLRILEATRELETRGGALLLMNMGNVYRQRGNLEAAMQAFQDSRGVFEATGKLETPDGAALLMNMGNLHSQTGDLDAAIQIFQESRGVLEAAGALETPDGALLMMNMGNIYAERCDLAAAMQAFQESRAVLEATGTLKTPGGASLLMNMGNVYSERGALDAALRAYQESRDVLEATDTLETSGGAKLLMNMGNTHQQRGDLNAAMKAYQDSRRVLEATNALESRSGTSLLMAIGNLHRQRGHLRAAIQAYQECYGLFKATGTLQTTEGAKLLICVGIVQSQRDELDAAMQAFQESRGVLEATGTLETPEGALLLMSMGYIHRQRGDSDGALQAFLQNNWRNRDSQQRHLAGAPTSGEVIQRVFSPRRDSFG